MRVHTIAPLGPARLDLDQRMQKYRKRSSQTTSLKQVLATMQPTACVKTFEHISCNPAIGGLAKSAISQVALRQPLVRVRF